MPRRRRAKKGHPGRFFRFPKAVHDSISYASLSPAAVKLLVDIGIQYNGGNNGNLACTFSMMKAKGWRSTSTLNRAKKELTEAGMIELTRQGGLSQGKRIPCLYALTWLNIDDCPGLDRPPSISPSGLWKT